MTKDRSEWTNSEDTLFPFTRVDEPENGVLFLTFKTRILWEQVHEYVRSMRSGYTTPSEKEYTKLREIMQLFRQYGEAQDDDTIHRVAEQAGRADKTVRSYLAGGLRNERQADFYHTLSDEDGAEETAEDVTHDFTWSRKVPVSCWSRTGC